MQQFEKLKTNLVISPEYIPANLNWSLCSTKYKKTTVENMHFGYLSQNVSSNNIIHTYVPAWSSSFPLFFCKRKHQNLALASDWHYAELMI